VAVASNSIEMICEFCTRWFCDDGECQKKLAKRDAYVRYTEKNDRTPYYSRYYQANRDKKIRAALQRYHAKKGLGETTPCRD
jgi:hypothetical protein